MTDEAKRIQLARRVTRSTRSDSESDIRQRIAEMFEAFGVEVKLEHRTSDGRADIYCPNRRIIIETKSVGSANEPVVYHQDTPSETPKQQLERYVRAEIQEEITHLPFLSDQPWIGIVTDGKIWNAWRYPHQLGTIGQEIAVDWNPGSGTDLAHWVDSILGDGLVGKPSIPVDPVPLFKPFLESLRKIYESRDQDYGLTTKKRLWLDMLKTASMQPSQTAVDRLFVTHSFLVSVARGAIATLMNPTANRLESTQALRDGFVAWITDSHRGTQWSRSLFKKIHSYEWRHQKGDVLRPLYESLVSEDDRKVFGEYYTPDWLAELMVREVLDEKWCTDAVNAVLTAIRMNRQISGIGVLDPTCGSGTFLYHAAKRILEANALKDLAPARQATVTSMLVNGIDVHPIAAELARATLLRALPAPPPDGEASLQVYQGDALLIRPGGEYTLFGDQEGSILIGTPKGHTVYLPRRFASAPTFVADLSRMIDLAKMDSEASLPHDIELSVPRQDRKELAEAFQEFRKIVQEEGNSIWAWYITNITGPSLLAGRKVDRIVANPPWVRMADIQHLGRKKDLEKFADKTLDIWTGGKQSPHFDIASLFIKRVREKYLNDPRNNVGAWLVKKSALKAGNWEKFRSWHREYVLQKLDLESVQPFGGGDARRPCVLLENRKFRALTSLASGTVAVTSTGNRPLAYQRLPDIEVAFSFVEVEDKVVQEASEYLDEDGTPLFRQGATITPQVLLVVSQSTIGMDSNMVQVRTTRSKKVPWKHLNPLDGVVPKQWIASVWYSKQLLPYAMAESPSIAIIPIDTMGQVHPNPGQVCTFWDELESIYSEYRGKGKSTPRTLLDQICFHGKLDAQLPLPKASDRRIVLCPRSGNIMRGARTSGGTLIDSTLYRWCASTDEEAAYLVGILNASCLDVAFKQSRKSGRDFHLHPWRNVPIPRFDSKDRNHLELVDLTTRAESIANTCVKECRRNLKQIGLSNLIRRELVSDGVSVEIDDVVEKIMPDGVVVRD